MAYTAWEIVRQQNVSLYGIDAPAQPPDHRTEPGLSGLEIACLDFLRDQCEELRFDAAHRAAQDVDGGSIRGNRVPLHMERDTDRLCMENALHRFFQTGDTHDAFDVYFCYLEMFIGNYSQTRKMIELLSEFEANASALLMKHRDHYSHSVYVFALGLAIYRHSETFRRAYLDFYALPSARAAAHHFLRYWGLAALFHDIGYPFELSFEEIKSYFHDSKQPVPYISYRGMPAFLKLQKGERIRLQELLGSSAPLRTVNAALALRAEQLLGKDYGLTAEQLCRNVLDQKPSHPEKFSNYMDHAYFSAVLLLRKLMEVNDPAQLTLADVDAITAILLHNSMFKFQIRVGKYKKPLEMRQHPLAYLLMLCDELQCWDRTSYGQNTRQELHPMWCELGFDGDQIRADYQYDCQLENKKAWAKGTYSKMKGKAPAFVRDIGEIVALGCPGALSLSISARFAPKKRRSRVYLSDSNFLHLYNFAVALNARYNYGDRYTEVTAEELQQDFDSLSLEYKLSNILQAKAFAGYLDAIDCFYTDRPVDHEKLECFTEADMDRIGPMEHDRWLTEKRSMGWRYDKAYKKQAEPGRMRERTRTHCLMIEAYAELSKREQDKDTEPMNCMLHLIEKFDGLRIYHE